MYREPGVLEAELQVGKWLDCSARITSKELAPILSVKNGILQNACSASPTCSASPKMDANLGTSALTHTARLTNSLEKSKKNGDKSELKNTRHLGCVSQDLDPPKSSSILRKSSNIRKPIRCVRLWRALTVVAERFPT